MENFVFQLFRGRWFMMFASFLIMAGAGATYLFGVYSKEIKATLGYDQSTLNLLGSFKDVGANVGVLSGLIAEVTPTWFVLLVGSAMNFAGYFLIWLSVTKRIAKPKVWQMCLYICVGANSQNFANTGALVTCVKNFPASRGMMLGLMKGFVGLSGAVFTQLYLAIYGNDSQNLILLIGWLPAILSIVFIPSIRPMKISSHPNETKVFFEYLGISITLALCLMGLTIAQKYVRFSHFAYIACATIVCALLFLPFLIAVMEELATRKEKKKQLLSSENVEDPPPPAENIEKAEEEKAGDYSCFGNIFKKPKRGEDYSILQALLSVDMLLLFICNFCGQGCSLAAIDNLGQIGESLGYPPRTIGTFVSLVSIWNYFGRVFSGFVSETIVKRWKIPRTLMMTFSLLLPCAGDLLVAFPFPGSVYGASLILGFSYGVQLTLLFIIISELFGLKYYSTLFNCGQLASPLGSYILNVKIVGRLYDGEAVKQVAARGVGELTCLGTQCYKVSFIVLAGVNLFGALVSLVLVARTAAYYKTDIYKRFRDEMGANNN
ncbi:PREDICTED: protein NUCLEAR FUSION DEFECTIVE 4-like [Ipomoea nil]|uniref:protein NUCLEAR FUSION DEFECTIVE 4-like n=1 Tax=Ipomoea nil TaxID=35883 RepID=UPI00090121B6|nr:PREDICTED: protein NUCLEAR FUSION DEFECTIVE 4-like [Ipomoea nil]